MGLFLSFGSLSSLRWWPWRFFRPALCAREGWWWGSAVARAYRESFDTFGVAIYGALRGTGSPVALELWRGKPPSCQAKLRPSSRSEEEYGKGNFSNAKLLPVDRAGLIGVWQRSILHWAVRTAENQREEKPQNEQSYQASANFYDNPTFWKLLPTGVAFGAIRRWKAIPYQSKRS